MDLLIETQYLPPVQFFCKFLEYDQVVLEQWEHYQKNSYRNRTHLAAANGLIRLSIPLEKGKHQQQKIRDVRISYAQNWQHQHWQSIQSAYGKAPFFEHYAPLLSPHFRQQPVFLFDWNLNLIRLLLRVLQIPDKKLVLSTSYSVSPNDQTHDFREKIGPFDPSGEQDPHFKATFYPQVFQEKHGFLPNLSVLDVLFCTGPQSLLLLQQSITQ